MDRRPSLPAAPRAASAGGLVARSGQPLLRAWPARVLLAALLLLVLEAVGLPLPDVLAVLARAAALVLGAYALFRLVRRLFRGLLWRIRTKLIVSYLFIAVVPVVLLTLFFLLAGLLGMSLVTSYMVSSHLERTAQELRGLARATLAGLDPSHPEAARQLAARVAQLRGVHPELAHAWLQGGRRAAGNLVSAGRPSWLKESGFAGAVVTPDGRALRGLWSAGEGALVFDLPMGGALFADIERRTGLRVLGEQAVRGRGSGTAWRSAEGRADLPPASQAAQDPAGVTAVAFVPLTHWDTGEVDLEPLALRFTPRALLARLAPSSLDAPDILVAGLTAVGGAFLVLYVFALGLGLLLARSITRSVHALSRGTQRLRRGDFSHPIPIQSRDQLGELAESFNTMASDIQDFLRQSAEKERLEEELRIARRIQMSLLPQEAVRVPGLRIAAVCLPAAEVGGDYYDLLPLPPNRLGVLVADVSGKGTSAALYMAELKGLVLSLSRIYQSPGKLLAEANRILAANMDSRSFVTMTYAVVDMDARRLRYARAGHTPIIHLEAVTARTRMLTPQGLGLGLDPGDRFEDILEEEEVPLKTGDLFLFFTDGISEAMNVQGEMFGERRLRDLLERNEALDSEPLKEAILDEIRGFVGEAAPHDDMTMVILKVA